MKSKQFKIKEPSNYYSRVYDNKFICTLLQYDKQISINDKVIVFKYNSINNNENLCIRIWFFK